MSDLSTTFDPAATQLPSPSYPAWQQAIRRAQFEMAARADKEEQARKEAEAARQKEVAPVFKKILALLGIEADPTGDALDIGQFHFWLEKYTNYSVGEPGEMIGFVIYITPTDPKLGALECGREIISGSEYNSSFEYNERGVPRKLLTWDWTPLRAKLADVLDGLSAEIEKARQVAAQPAPEAPAKMVLDADTQDAVDFLKDVAAHTEAGYSLARHEGLLFAFAKFLALDSGNLDYLAGIESVGMLR